MDVRFQKTVAILGSGLIGCNWACLFASHGYKVVLYDTSPQVVHNAVATAIPEILKQPSFMQVVRGNFQPEDSELQLFSAQVKDNISIAHSLDDALRDAYYAQECVFEDLEVKKAVFKQIDMVLEILEKSGRRELPVVASSTSCLLPSLFTENLLHKDRYLVVHPLNPPLYLNTVEIVPSPWTSTKSLMFSKTVVRDIRMKPICLKREIDGFVFNRLQYALLAEAWHLVEEGYVDPIELDDSVKIGLARRWSITGPFQTIDCNAPHGVRDYVDRYSEGITRVLKDMYSKGIPDFKSGAGFDSIEASMRKRSPEKVNIDADRKQRDNALAAIALHFTAATKDELG